MIHRILIENARRFPDRTAVVHRERRVTYGELADSVARIGAFLIRQGIRKGDRVAICSENSPEYIVSCFGTQIAGGISVDINPQYSSNEMSRIIDDCLPSALIVESRHLRVALNSISGTATVRVIIVINNQRSDSSRLPGIDDRIASHVDIVGFETAMKSVSDAVSLPDISFDDIASIVYTSGTTGAPKGVMLSHENFAANASSIVQYLHLGENDSAMVVLPFCYSYGKSLLNTHIMAGGSLVLENSFMYPNVVLERMVEEEVTGFAGVPSTFAIILNRSNIRNYRFPKLRYLTQAGGAMPSGHAKALSSLMPDAKIYIMYGQTEATARLTYLDPDDLPSKPGSIGKAIPGVEIWLEGNEDTLDGEGEIVAQGRNIMAGYWNRPEETVSVLRDGVLHTGDVARMDEEGFLYIVGRRSDMIKSGAHRISPKEIEEIILELGQVHEVAVLGIDDEILGQAIKAVIVLKNSVVLNEKMVQRHCHMRLASFKTPKKVDFVHELPKTVSGKIRKHLLKTEKELA